MLRQRNIKAEPESAENGGGFSIGGFDDHMSVTNGKMKSMDDPCNCWKYISVLLLTVTGVSVCLNIYQYTLLRHLDEKHSEIHSEWQADRAHKDVCMTELESLESHIKSREEEKFGLEQEVSRLKRAIQKGGVTDHPVHQRDGDTPPTPHPQQDGPTPPPDHQQEEARRQHEEQKRQQEEQQRLQQEQQKQQEEQQRLQQEQQKQHEEQQRLQQEQQRQQEEQHRQQEEQRRQQEEHQRQQEEQQRQQEEQLKQQQEQQRQQEEHRRQKEEQQEGSQQQR